MDKLSKGSIVLSREEFEFMSFHGTMVEGSKSNYLFLPYYFELGKDSGLNELSSSVGLYSRAHKLGRLPDELVDLLGRDRGVVFGDLERSYYIDFICVEEGESAMFGVYEEGKKGLVDYGTWDYCRSVVMDMGGNV